MQDCTNHRCQEDQRWRLLSTLERGGRPGRSDFSALLRDEHAEGEASGTSQDIGKVVASLPPDFGANYRVAVFGTLEGGGRPDTQSERFFSPPASEYVSTSERCAYLETVLKFRSHLDCRTTLQEIGVHYSLGAETFVAAKQGEKRRRGKTPDICF